MNILVTGGAGFIGSAVCRLLASNKNVRVVNVDLLTYAGNLDSLKSISNQSNYTHYKVDICDQKSIIEILNKENINIVMHLAAESHVDRSIDSPAGFVETNVVGTFRLLNASLEYWRTLPRDQRDRFRFHHVSTDEVFGDLPFHEGMFTEETPYAPSSPYSASKASSDHFVRAWHETYGLPTVISNCSNNYGPFHFPEKLIPLVILNALDEVSLPIYGSGANVRDWLHVEDHARALVLVAQQGKVGESYNIGARAEKTNLEVVEAICVALDNMRPRKNGESYLQLITHVADRPGHDRRYAIDPSKIERDLGWSPKHSFKTGLEDTIRWYLDNSWWWKPIREGKYSGQRLGQVED